MVKRQTNSLQTANLEKVKVENQLAICQLTCGVYRIANRTIFLLTLEGFGRDLSTLD